MNRGLTYLPAYLGLFATEVLAMTCNTYFDIRYGIFPTEFMLWSAFFAHSLWIGWRQHGVSSKQGRALMYRYLAFALLMSLLFFFPKWNPERAAVFSLGGLLIAYNCITTTRRQLHLGLLMTLVMVIFASTHFLADWTLLFYLIPYVAAAVFTLVSEQINRKVDDLRQQSYQQQVMGGQLAAIAAASASILGLGLLLYLLTPQIFIPNVTWEWGSPLTIGNKVGDNGNGQSGEGENGGGKPGSGQGARGNQSGAGGSGQSGGGQGSASGQPSNWPTPQEMRRAAERKGMPEWQASAIRQLADASEWTQITLRPLQHAWEQFKQWLLQHRLAVLSLLLLLIVLSILYAFWKLMDEIRLLTWLRTRYDYLTLGMLPVNGSAQQLATRYYQAMQRLFRLHDIEPNRQRNTQEYQAYIQRHFRDLTPQTSLLTRLFEDARYGPTPPSTAQCQHMQAAYLQLYRQLQ